MSAYLSKREQQIMELLFARGQATANEVVDGLPDRVSNPTVRTLLRILEDKGEVTHDTVEGRFIYRPLTPPDQAAKGALAKLVDTFFKGSIKSAVASLIEVDDKRLTADELTELQELIDQARRKGAE